MRSSQPRVSCSFVNVCSRRRSPPTIPGWRTATAGSCSADQNTMSEPISSRMQDKRQRVIRAIRALPRGKVSTYGAIARAAGWPGAARQVVRVLNQVPGLPWHRVVGSGGAIKLPGEQGAEQKFRLRMEGVAFRGTHVDMKRHEHKFPKSRQSSARSRSARTKRRA